jgi:ubiquinone/menaquinone biosynthesis C-methylase UbiE
MATATNATVEQATSADSERIKQAVYDEWQSAAIAAAYRKWSVQETAWGSKTTEFIVDRARVAPGMTVLDLAGGHGEPSLALAAAVGPSGHVTATDQGPALLAIAEERARQQGLQNMTFRVADAHALPFPDGAFDRVTSKMGIMYFVELPRALREIRRVLKPGGRATFMVWGPFEQPFLEILVGTLFAHVTLPEPDPGAPNPFRFAEPGTLSAALSEAGLREIEEEQATIPTPFPGTPRLYWDWFWELAPPLEPLLAALAPSARQRVIDDTVAALAPYDDGTHVTIPIQVVVASCIR